jgi:serine/threonine-protein kinase
VKSTREIDLLARAHQLQPVRNVAGTTATGEVRPPASDPGVQRRHGRYVLGDLLGRGGMAEVFAGHAIGSHGFQKPVAIKRLLPELANDHVFVERLIGEAKLLVGMQHGNIVSVLDLARDGDDVFLVMEYVDGPTLRQLLKARGSRGLPLGVATYIVQSAAAGLEFAHARPGGAVVHADISPSNLLLTTSGEVRVADFGIARREGGNNGIVEGKWAYMAPEQARGEALTPRSDVFALGVVLYELVTGQHPLGRQVTAGEREAPPRVIPPRVVMPWLSPGIDAICMRALAHDPRERYPRMQHLIDALVEERFTSGLREGASDLAHVIREITPGAPTTPSPRTQVTDRPVTIMTRSLITQPPPARQSSPAFADTMLSPGGVLELIARGSSNLAVPELPNADIAPVPSVTAELASVHGGATGTGHLDVRDARNHRWTLVIFGIAALVGAIAAVAISLAPDDADEAPSPIAVAQQRVDQAMTLQRQAPPPIVIPIEPAAPTLVTPPAAVEPALPEPARPAPHARTHVAPPVKKAVVAADATLRVDSGVTWTVVAIAGQPHQDTPGAVFHLAPGKYVVKLTNQELGVRRCTVSVESGRVVTLRVDMESKGDDACWVE